MVALGVRAVSYERGNPVCLPQGLPPELLASSYLLPP